MTDSKMNWTQQTSARLLVMALVKNSGRSRW